MEAHKTKKKKQRQTHQRIIIRKSTYYRLRELADLYDIPVTALLDKMVKTASPSESQQLIQG